MSKEVLWSIVIVIVLAALGWGYWSLGGPGTSIWSPPREEMSAATSTPATDTDSSDSAIDQDLVSIDGHINAFEGDNASVSAGLSDQQVQQSSL